jgi:carboxyl-terminal processing protease
MSLCLGQAAFEANAVADETVAPSRIAESIEQGKRLEIDRRWQEAIQIYEKILRKAPTQVEIERRLQIVRIHYDVSRRYADPSFLAAVDRTQPNAALDLTGEILTKLQLYYVEPVDFGRLVRNGTAFLEVALTEPEFLKRNVGPSVPADRVEQFRLNIHRSILGIPVNSIQDVRMAVSQAAVLARDQIGLPSSAVVYEYLSGFVGMLDPYSAYLTGGEYREIMSQIEGNLIGIGVELWAEADDLRIVEVFSGAPSEEAGLSKGDRLLEIGGVKVSDIGAKRAADLLRGPEGSTVKLVFEKARGGRGECTIRRRRVDVPSVGSVRIVDSEAGLGYIRISNFQRTTSGEVDDALRTLHSQGLKSLIIDLRRNPGGLLDAAVDIADRFLMTGNIVSTRGRNEHENRKYTAKMPGTWDIPLMVMIDEDSASASEIFAGAIQDQNRGIIVGRTSYGKGSVQGVFQNELGEGGIRLTISKFFSPAGHAISARGIIPHVNFDEASPFNDHFAAKPVSKVDVGAMGEAKATSATPNASAADEDLDLIRAVEIARVEFAKIARRQ